MNANFARFTAALKADPVLHARVEALESANLLDAAKQLAAISAEAGTPVSVPEILAMGSEVSEAELEMVSGGVGPWDEQIIKDHQDAGGLEWYERLLRESAGNVIRDIIGRGPSVPGRF